MPDRIKSPEEYQAALDRIAALRQQDETPEQQAELAALEGAIAAYEMKPDEPDTSKGRPTPHPYD